jgi:hypothetical protein
MKQLKKETLYTITELTADKIIQMSDEQLIAFQETLSNAVNLFPVQKDRLEESFRKMDYPPTLQWLKSMRNTLNQIHADNLVKQCDKHLALNHDLENIRHDRLKTFIEFFMATLAMLYKDIQLALDELAFEEKIPPEECFARKTKEQLATIEEINVASLDHMTDEQLKAYIKTLGEFYNDSSARENGLKSSFKIKNYASAMRWLNAIESALSQIHAEGLAEECRRQINLNNDFSSIRHEKFELFVNYVLTSLNMLCNDIASLKLEQLKLVRR